VTRRLDFLPMKRLILLCLLWLLPGRILAGQDTLTVMVYNLLYYGVNTSFCNQSNNNVDLKDANLRTILSHVRPDVFAVNEMGRGEATSQRLLEQVLNRVDEGRYEMAGYTNTRNSTIVNMLYFDRHKFGLHSEAVLANEVRDINLYTLYYRSPGLEYGQDTLFLSCIVAHLKAGSNQSDQQTRLREVMAMMSSLELSGLRGNIMFMGDFNMNASYEQAYGHLTHHPNEAIRFYDPIDRPGQWYNNPEMAAYHTQSPRTGSQSCFVAGGLDDRYDQILAARSIIQGTEGLRYLEGSYHALGQDGLRFNQSLTDPPNYSEPQAVIMALYNASDHLPVILRLEVTQPQTLAGDVSHPAAGLANLVNPVHGWLSFSLDMDPGGFTVGLYTLSGQPVLDRQAYLDFTGQPFVFDVSGIPRGVYILQVHGSGGQVVSRKLWKR